MKILPPASWLFSVKWESFLSLLQKKRKIFFQKLKKSPYTTCFFETPHRITDTLQRLEKELLEESQVFIGRELTKKYESTYFGSPQKVAEEVKKDPQKGEYTLVVKN